jgi:hypothetical protein
MGAVGKQVSQKILSEGIIWFEPIVIFF